MKFKDVHKGDYILNTKVDKATPWWVCLKLSGMVCIRRNPKIGKLVALMPGQLRNFIIIDYKKWQARNDE